MNAMRKSSPRRFLTPIVLLLFFSIMVGGIQAWSCDGYAIQAERTTNSPQRAGVTGQSNETHGPYELKAADMRALLARRRRPNQVIEDRSVSSSRDLPEVRADSDVAAEGGGRQPVPKPGPPGPPNPKPQSPSPLLSWEAPGMTAGAPPDPQIAVSHTHVVVATQLTLSFFKKDGTQVGTTDFVSFFSPMGLNDGTVNGSEVQSDPRLIFDSYRNRFWLIHGAGNGQWKPTDQNVRGRIYAAVSKTENPLDGWYLYWWDAVADWHKPGSTIYKYGDGADYPCIGIDPVAFYQTIHVGNNGKGRYTWVVIKPADQLANGVKADGSWVIFVDPNGNYYQNVAQPAVHHGSTDHAYFVGRWDTDKLVIWTISNPLQIQPTMSRAVVTLVHPQKGNSVPFGATQDAPQNKSAKLIAMTNLGTDVLKAVYRNGLLYVVTNDARDWFNDGQMLTSIRLVRLFVGAFPNIPTKGNPSYINRVFGKNNIYDDKTGAEHMYYGWPAVEVNRNGDMVIIYARIGSTIYPQVRFSVYYHNESDIRPSRLLHDGEAPYDQGGSPLRWGDCAGASVDPSDDTAIWVVHEYAKTGGNYGIWVGEVSP